MKSPLAFAACFHSHLGSATALLLGIPSIAPAELVTLVPSDGVGSQFFDGHLTGGIFAFDGETTSDTPWGSGPYTILEDKLFAKTSDFSWDVYSGISSPPTSTLTSSASGDLKSIQGEIYLVSTSPLGISVAGGGGTFLPILIEGTSQQLQPAAEEHTYYSTRGTPITYTHYSAYDAVIGDKTFIVGSDGLENSVYQIDGAIARPIPIPTFGQRTNPNHTRTTYFQRVTQDGILYYNNGDAIYAFDGRVSRQLHNSSGSLLAHRGKVYVLTGSNPNSSSSLYRIDGLSQAEHIATSEGRLLFSHGGYLYGSRSTGPVNTLWRLEGNSIVDVASYTSATIFPLRKHIFFTNPGNLSPSYSGHNLYRFDGTRTHLEHEFLPDYSINWVGTLRERVYINGTLGGYSVGSHQEDIYAISLGASSSDVDGDSKPDLVWQHADSGEIALWNMEGAAPDSGGPINVRPPLSWEVVGLEDFSGDNAADLILQNGQTGALAVWHIEGTTVTGGGHLPALPPSPHWQVAAAVDINLDLHNDLILQNSNTGAVVVWEMDASGASFAARMPALQPGPSWRVADFEDMTGDGCEDLILQNRENGMVVVWALDSDLTFTPEGGPLTYQPPGSDYQVVDAADFDGDGHHDLLFQHSGSGRGTIWYMDGLKVKSGEPITPDPVGWQIRNSRALDVE